MQKFTTGLEFEFESGLPVIIRCGGGEGGGVGGEGGVNPDCRLLDLIQIGAVGSGDGGGGRWWLVVGRWVLELR